MRRWLLPFTLIITVGACARPLPKKPASAALYRDIQRLVTLAEAAGWEIDRVEVEELVPSALMSVCQTTPDARAELSAWLRSQEAKLGGPVEEAYRKRGRDLSKVEDLVELVRVRAVLLETLEAAERDCPFWLEPDPEFSGRQLADDRWQLSFGGGGRGILVVQGDERDLNFGGAGRLLLGRGLGSRWTLFGGLEMGGAASFPKDESGERGQLVLGFDVVTPVVARLRFVNSYVEFETGYLAHFTEEDRTVQNGFRLGAAIGGRAGLARRFFPGVAFGASYERTFTPDGADRHTVRIGLRAAIDFNFSK